MKRRSPWYKKCQKSENVPTWYENMESKYLQLLETKLSVDAQLETLRDELLTNMKDENLRRIVTDKTNINIVREHKTCSVDAKALKRDYPMIYKTYAKPFTTKEHLQIFVL